MASTALFSSGRIEWEELKRWLSSLPAEVLAGWLWDEALRNRPLEIVLRCEAAQAAAGGLDVSVMREAIDRLTEVRPNTTWRESKEIGAQIDAMVELLGRALDRGQAAATVELSERALQRVELAVMEVQDSEYWSSRVLDELSALHVRACTIARPDPVALATRWFHLRWKSPLGWYGNFPEQYVDVLGATGLETLAGLTEEALKNLPPESARHSWDGNRSKLQSLRGDLEKLRRT